MGAPPGLDVALGLLEGALDYTREALAPLDRGPGDGDPTDLTRPTPCHRWDLGGLLAHMEDSLDAFAEGADGTVSLDPRVPAPVRAEGLRRKACHLLGTWSAATPETVVLGDCTLPTTVLAHAAALEITVHGWDVAATLRPHDPAPAIPPGLAGSLLGVAGAVVAPDDRGERFATARPTYAGDDAESRLLAFVGRDRSRPVAGNPAVRRTRPPRAS